MFEAIIFILAGLVTGIITGLVGASAIVAFIPLILIFFDYDAFTLIGMSLVLDVFIALPAIRNYLKKKNVNLKTGIYLAFPAMFGAVIGSNFSLGLQDLHLIGITALFISLSGIILFNRKHIEKKSGTFAKDLSLRDFKFWFAMVASLVIGFLGGTIGAAGGISILIVLLFIFKFEIHEAVGTSIFIMLFIAIFGAATHFYYLDQMHFSWFLLALAVVGGVVGSRMSSKIANRVPEKVLNRTVGAILILLGLITFGYKVLF